MAARRNVALAALLYAGARSAAKQLMAKAIAASTAGAAAWRHRAGGGGKWRAAWRRGRSQWRRA